MARRTAASGGGTTICAITIKLTVGRVSPIGWHAPPIAYVCVHIYLTHATPADGGHATHLLVEAAGPAQCRVHAVGAVRRPDYQHLPCCPCPCCPCCGVVEALPHLRRDSGGGGGGRDLQAGQMGIDR